MLYVGCVTWCPAVSQNIQKILFTIVTLHENRRRSICLRPYALGDSSRTVGWTIQHDMAELGGPRRLEERCDYQAAKKGSLKDCKLARNHTTFHTRQSLQQNAAKQTARCSRLHPTGWAGRIQKRAFMHWTNIQPALNITEQSLEHQQDLIINFINFKKAFDSVHRSNLWKILRYYGIPDRFVNIFKALYDNSSYCVKTASGYTEFFEIVSGVRKSCILSPFFFIIVIDFFMHRTMDKS